MTQAGNVFTVTFQAPQPLIVTKVLTGPGTISVATGGLSGGVVAGPITVTETASNMFTISFGGSLAGYSQSPILANVTAGPATGTANAFASLGDDAALVNEAFDPAGIASPSTLVADNTWRGNVSLDNSSTLDVQTSTRLSLTGNIDDSSLTGSDVTKIGSGELVLSGTNTYRGVTYVNQGTLTVASSQALGNAGVAAVQNIAFTGATSGTQYTLTFDGYTTPTLAYTNSSADAGIIQTALNNLPVIRGSANGAVTVSQSLNTFVITLGGSLSGFYQPNIIVTIASGPGTATQTLVSQGSGGTVVANGAALQLEGNITVAGEPLQVQGTGLAETQSLNLSGATPGTTNFDLTFNKATTAILTYTGTSADAANIQAALDALSTIGGLTPNPGSVTVTQVQPGLFTLTFGGSLASASQPPLSITIVGGTGNATVLTNLNAPMVASGQNVTQLQTLTISGATAGTQYTLTFNGATTGKLTYTGSAADATTIQKALDALATVGGVSGTVTVTFIQPGTYSIIFGGDLVDSEQPLITGVVVTGTGNVSNLTNLNAQLDWSAVGPAPVQSDSQVTLGAQNTVAGRVTGIAVDPSSPNTIYISTAGGGAWRTVDGGQSWTQLFDAPGVLFSGAIAVAPSDPTVIYLGTGEADNSTDSYYGTGVFVSTNSGQTWSLLTSANGTNPLFGLTVSKIAIDPQNSKLIYVASGDLAENTPTTAGTPGVYRYDGTNWTDLTSAASVTKFPQTKINWSDVALAIRSGTASALYAALGTPSGSAGGAFVQNGVYELTSQGTVGTNTNWTQNLVPTAGTDFGNVKIAVDGAALVAGVPATVVYAIAANTSNGLQELESSTNGGTTWTAVTLPAGALGSLTEYALSIVMLQDSAGDTVYVGGEEASSATHLQMIYGTTTGGTNWTDLSVDGGKNNPETNVHGMALDSNSNLDVGTDGGVWQLTSGGASPTNDWSDLNGNLATSQVLGVAVNPTNPDNIYAGTEEDGVAEYSGNEAWTWLNTNALSYGAGTVLMNANNPQTLFAADSGSVLVGLIEESTNGGTTWSQIGPALQPGFVGLYPYFPLAVDPNNPSRIVFGGNFPSSVLEQSVDGGVTWTNLSTNLPLFYPSVTSIAIAGDQGTFQADASFPLVTDIGANNYDPNTMYVTNGSTIYLTKNDGTSWVNRTSTLPAGIQISDIVVDPTNEYTAYVVTSNPSGSGIGRVYMTTNGGQKWTNISANLPDVPTWTLTIDPRTKAGTGDGTLYIGNDDGVYELPNGASTWQRFGEGLPNVQVRTIQLNQAANTLTVGTYGRGVYQFALDNVQINNTLCSASAARRSGPATSSWKATPPSARAAPRSSRTELPQPS